MDVEVRQFVHDGLILFFTEQSIKSDSDIIGFYFDNKGLVQNIHKSSVYGYHIKRKFNNRIEYE